MSAEYAIQVITGPPVEESHASCDDCHWSRLEETVTAYQPFVNAAKSHCHHTGHTVQITRGSASTTTVTRREITAGELEG